MSNQTRTGDGRRTDPQNTETERRAAGVRTEAGKRSGTVRNGSGRRAGSSRIREEEWPMISTTLGERRTSTVRRVSRREDTPQSILPDEEPRTGRSRRAPVSEQPEQKKEPARRRETAPEEPVRRRETVQKEPVSRKETAPKEPVSRRETAPKEPVSRRKAAPEEPVRRRRTAPKEPEAVERSDIGIEKEQNREVRKAEQDTGTRERSARRRTPAEPVPAVKFRTRPDTPQSERRIRRARGEEEREIPSILPSEEAPAPRRRAKAVREEEEAPAPRRRAKAVREEEEAPAPRRRAKAVREEEEAPAPRRRATVVREEEETPAPRRPRERRPVIPAAEPPAERRRPARRRRASAPAARPAVRTGTAARTGRAAETVSRKGRMSAAARARRARQVRIRLAVLVIAIAIAASVIIVRAANRWSINMTLNGDQVVTLNLGEVFDDPGATATAEGSTRPLAKKKLDIRTDGEVNNQEIGTYTLTYSASYEDVTESVERTVEVVDTEPPVIDLVQNPDSFTVPGEEYEEEGYSAYDNYDGDLTSQVKREEENGIIHYEVTDSSGNRAVAERAVIYDDKTAPEITLEGGEEITVQQGTTFTDEYSATDDVDGDLTDQVEVEGEVDVNTAGDYTLKYIVKDSHDNIASAERVVHVKRVSSSTEGYKLVYLTFDDGPGPYTEELLDILDRYNVKATFFVTNGFPKYQDLIGEEARRGHAVAVHTYCHDYDVVYQSDEAFWEDFDKMNDIIEQQTGQKSDMMRFPGGSSNTVSRKYSNGIMTRLTEQAEKKGYAYFDWNVLSGDAGDTQDSDEIVKNMIDGISERNTSIILCHDIHDFTVNAMDDFLSWATENGYTFAPLTKDSYTAHQGVNN